MRIRLPGPIKIKPAIPHLFELPISYDVLVGATQECLPGYLGDGGVNFEKIHETPGSYTYKLSHNKLGNLGNLIISKLREDLSEVHFDGPPSAASQRRKPTQEERVEIDSASNKDERVKANIAVNKKIKGESIGLYNQRNDHLGVVISGYLDRLSRKNFLPKEALPEKPKKLNGTSDLDFEPLPKWWPKNEATKIRWKVEYRKIKPLHDHGYSNQAIGKKLGINRQRIPHIIKWASQDPAAHK